MTLVRALWERCISGNSPQDGVVWKSSSKIAFENKWEWTGLFEPYPCFGNDLERRKIKERFELSED